MKSPINRAIDKIKVCSDRECWIWTGCKTRKGYGLFRFKKKMILAHRFFYNFEHPEFSIENKDLKNSLDHFVCQNPSCVNPDHLEPVTTRENVTRSKTSALKKNKSSKYPGVSWDKNRNKWMVRIRVGFHYLGLGRFNNEKKASLVYENKRREIEGEEINE